MFGLDSEAEGKLVFALYALLGVPIAWIFIKQQKMTGSVQQASSGASRLVVLVLALMWPVLLFCMALNRYQGRGKRGSHKKDFEGRPGNDR